MNGEDGVLGSGVVQKHCRNQGYDHNARMRSTLVVGVANVLLVGDVLGEGRRGDEVGGGEILLLADVYAKDAVVQGALR